MKDQQAREDISNLAKRTFPTTTAYDGYTQDILSLKSDVTRLNNQANDHLQLISNLSDVSSGLRVEITELKSQLADQEQRTFRANQMVFELEQRLKKIEARFVVRCPKCKQVIPEKESITVSTAVTVPANS